MSKIHVSKALREVVAWKEAGYREVAHLPTEKALREIIRRAEKTAHEMGFVPVTGADHHRLAVAEEPGRYVTKQPKRR